MPDKQPDSRYLKLVYSLSWEELLPDLLIHAGEYYGYLSPGDREELVHIAIEKVLRGVQPWNPEKRPEIRRHLAWVLKSVISNDLKRAGMTRRASCVNNGDGRMVNPVDLVTEPSRPADEDLIIEERLNRIRRAAAEDEEAELIMMALEDGITKPSEIAAETGIAPARVYAIFKRIRRRAAKLSEGEKVL